jgi:hypothetical protein
MNKITFPLRLRMKRPEVADLQDASTRRLAGSCRQRSNPSATGRHTAARPASW